MKIITPEMLPEDVEPGDQFINTDITALSKVIYIHDDYDPHKKARPYFKAMCKCGNLIEGKKYPYGRWDRMHSTNANMAPHTMRCTKCSAGGKPRGMPTTWLNTAKSENEISMNNFNDLSGQYFGDLFVEKCVGTDKRSHRLYKCICSCGNEEILADDRLKGYKVACSQCLSNISTGEKFIKNVLEKNHIKFQHHYKFDDLFGDVRQLDLDFAILNDDNTPSVLIEFQGAQHYRPVEHWGGQKQFEKQVRYDNKKREYCKNHNYRLIEFPYTMPFNEIEKTIIDLK